jgi:hypothetical protein
MIKKGLSFSNEAVTEPKAPSFTMQASTGSSHASSVLIQRIISSNEELIHEQMMKIR